MMVLEPMYINALQEVAAQGFIEDDPHEEVEDYLRNLDLIDIDYCEEWDEDGYFIDSIPCLKMTEKGVAVLSELTQ